MDGNLSMQNASLDKLCFHQADDIVRMFECDEYQCLNQMMTTPERSCHSGAQDYKRKTNFCEQKKSTRQPASFGSQCDQKSDQSCEEAHPRLPATPSSGRNNDFQRYFATNPESTSMMRVDRDSNLNGCNTLQAFNDLDNATSASLALASTYATARENNAPYGQGGDPHSHSFQNSDFVSLLQTEHLKIDCAPGPHRFQDEHENLTSLNSFEEFLSKTSTDGIQLNAKHQIGQNVNEGKQIQIGNKAYLPQPNLSALFDYPIGAFNKDIACNKISSDCNNVTAANDRIEENSFLQQLAQIQVFAPENNNLSIKQSANTSQFAQSTPSELGVEPVYGPNPRYEHLARLDDKHHVPCSEVSTTVSSISNQFNNSATDPLLLQLEKLSQGQFSSQQTNGTFLSLDASQQAFGSTQTPSVSNFIENIQKDLIDGSSNVFSSTHDHSYSMTDTQSQSWHSFDYADSQTITPKRVSKMGQFLSTYMTPSLHSRLGDESMLSESQTPSTSHSQRYTLIESFHGALFPSPLGTPSQHHCHYSLPGYHRLADQSFPVPGNPSSGHGGLSKMMHINSVHSPFSRSSSQSPSSQVSNVSEPFNAQKRKLDLMHMNENQKNTNGSFLGGSSPLSSSTSSSSHSQVLGEEEDEDDVFGSKKIQARSKKLTVILKRSAKKSSKEIASRVSYERSYMPDSDTDDEKENSKTAKKARLSVDKDDNESIDCANVLMSLGHSRADGLAFQHLPLSSGRSKRAARRANVKSKDQSIQFPKFSNRHYQAPKKTYDVGSERNERSHLSTDSSIRPHRPSLEETGIRSFSLDVPMDFNGVNLLETFPMFYRKFRVPSVMGKTAQAGVFGITSLDDVSKIDDIALRQAATRGLKKVSATFNEPESLFDLYTPRYTRGTGPTKEGVCPICFEEGYSIWLNTKHSQYNYHLTNQHGISHSTLLPMDPPIAYRMVEGSRSLNGKRKEWMLQGKCHACEKFHNIESEREGMVNVPEIYFWKHANTCHKKVRNPPMAKLGGCPFVEDELYRRAVEFEERQNK